MSHDRYPETFFVTRLHTTQLTHEPNLPDVILPALTPVGQLWGITMRGPRVDFVLNLMVSEWVPFETAFPHAHGRSQDEKKLQLVEMLKSSCGNNA